MSEAPAISVRGLTKQFGDVRAVDDLSFTVAKGEIFGLLGPNGAGKTSTIQLMLGLTTPTSGEIEILGMSTKKQLRAILQRVNFSSAYITLPSNLTVFENLNVTARLYGVRKAKQKILDLLEQFEIPDFRKRITGGLSSGQLTRVNLCKALLNDPDVLFLDEPTASLDPDIAHKLRDFLREIQRERGLTIVYTSHNMAEVEVVCDRVMFIAKGRSVLEGTPAEIRAGAQNKSLEQVFIDIARNGEVIAKPAAEAASEEN